MWKYAALAPLDKESGLYDSPGVDIFRNDPNDPVEGGDHVEWIDFAGTWKEFTAEAAEHLIAELGYETAGKWEEHEDYHEIALTPKEER